VLHMIYRIDEKLQSTIEDINGLSKSFNFHSFLNSCNSMSMPRLDFTVHNKI
jgi:hypothetical protein